VFRQNALTSASFLTFRIKTWKILLGRRRKIGNGPVFRMNREIQKRYFQPLEITPS